MIGKGTLSVFYVRGLEQLRKEIEQYASDADLWKRSGSIPNSGGNLTLHLIGNLNHFIGATLGNSGYVRDRDREFSDSDISREKLIGDIDSTIDVVRRTIDGLNKADLKKTFPIEVFGKPETTEFMLMHLATHLSYHLGQINYHRRSLTTN